MVFVNVPRPLVHKKGHQKSSPGGPVISRGAKKNRFGEQAVRAQRFFFILAEKNEIGEKVEITVLLQREHHFQGSRGAKMVPWGAPGRPT